MIARVRGGPVNPGRYPSLRLLALAVLILTAGTADVVLPSVADLPCSSMDPAEAGGPELGDFCRIRRDGLSAVRRVLAVRRLGPSESRTPLRVTCARVMRPAAPVLKTEHHVVLSRRARAPGLHIG